jgi:hypothetical protein
MGLGVVLILLGVVNSAGIVKAQREKEINRVVDRRLQNRR